MLSMAMIPLFLVTICEGSEDIDNSPNNIRNAFLLSCGAGLSTVIGALFAFFLKKDNLRKERCTFLAACLSFAAAVMVYVSLIEIWPEALHQFEQVTESPQLAHIYTSLTFFGGIIMGMLCSRLVLRLETIHSRRKSLQAMTKPVDFLGEVQQNIIELPASQYESDGELSVAGEEFSEVPGYENQKSQLLRTGIVTAVSIALHNFPEGLVTFLAALTDWRVGVTTAFAIAMHNIPEGISIALPYYYASESRWKAFLLAFLSGAAEPVGALIGWAILGDIWGHEVFGVMFGLTAGIMVIISFRELLPLARKNDPEDKVTTYAIVVGMLAMDISLFVAA